MQGRLKIPDNVGDFITGMAAFVAALVAWLGVERWEERKRTEIRAEVAAEALVAALEYLGFLNTTLDLWGLVDSEAEADAWIADLKTSYAPVSKASRRAEVYLPKASAKALEVISKLHSDTVMAFRMYILELRWRANQQAYDRDAFMKRMEPTIQLFAGLEPRRASIEMSARDTLKPQALYSDRFR